MQYKLTEALRITAVGGASLVLGIGRVRGEKGQPFRPSAWLRVDGDGRITITVSKSEMGQGVRTSLPMILAEELDADWKRVWVEQAMPGPDFSRLGTGGSWSIGGSWKALRQAGATAREMLLLAAAARWKVERAALRTERGAVVHDASGRRATYGELAAAAASIAVPKDVPLKSPKDFRSARKPAKRVSERYIESLRDAAITIEATYVNPFYVHAPVETMRAGLDETGRIVSWRNDHSYAIPSVFARESFLDEAAHAAGRDPLQLRLDLLGGAPRLRRVVEIVRDRAEWGKRPGQGVACNMDDGETCIAYVAEVARDKAKRFRVERVVAAVDCGPIINPTGVRQQMEGGIVRALAQLRIDEVPKIEVHLVPGDGNQPFGMGEPPVPPLIPAVLNAWFGVSGERVRRLPI